ncbi:hypothetical protein KR222_005077, partial [Zaprionus bogoriensis]
IHAVSFTVYFSHSFTQRLPCFSVANIHAKFKEARGLEHPMGHSYKRYKQPGTAVIALSSDESLALAQTTNEQLQQHQQRLRGQSHQLQLQRQQQLQQQQQQQQQSQLALRSSSGRLHQVHDAGRGPSQAQTLPAGGFTCRKHPNGGSNLNLYLHNDLERRFYFEKPAVSKCNLHSRSFAKSLNELCMEPTPPAPPPPPPPPPPLQPLPPPHATFADLPQEFPLTRSVSTSTDIYNADASVSQLQRRQRRNMATNTQQLPPQDEDDGESVARLCGLKRGLRKTKDELFQEFCKRAGVRSKPKHMYYVSGEEQDEHFHEPRHNNISSSNSNSNNYRNSSNNNNNNSNNNNSSNSNNHDVHNENLNSGQEDDGGDENGFRYRPTPAAIMDEDHLYVVGDHVELVMPRRPSMCVDPMQAPLLTAPQFPQLRKLNSNLSLHTPQSEIWPWPSQQLLASEHGQSRTLPRCFLRQPAGSQDSLGSLQSSFSYNAGAGAGANQQRFSQLMQQNQQQLQQQNRYLSTLTLPMPLQLPLPLPLNRAAGEEKHSQQQQQSQSQSQSQPQSAVQWPAAIPSSPSNYGHAPAFPPQPLFAPVSSSAAATAAAHPPKFQRAYAFDDAQRRGSYAVSEAFDLDEMERERRRSHASLFG